MTFTAPTTYAEAKALMGKDVETPIGTLHCTGAGLHGVAGTPTEEYSINFHNAKGNVAISWSSIDGWVTLAEQKARTWKIGYDRLSTAAHKLLDLVLGTELKDIPVERRANVDKLLRIAKRRLIKAGKMTLKTCARCGGGGKFSYNEIDGDMCYGCGGSGKVLPTTTDALRVARK
jgi:hypothetical protein